MYTENQLRTISVKLRRFRLDNGFTLKQMSLILKISKPSLSAMEKQRSVPDYIIDEILVRMQEKFEISLWDAQN